MPLLPFEPPFLALTLYFPPDCDRSCRELSNPPLAARSQHRLDCHRCHRLVLLPPFSSFFRTSCHRELPRWRMQRLYLFIPITSAFPMWRDECSVAFCALGFLPVWEPDEVSRCGEFRPFKSFQSMISTDRRGTPFGRSSFSKPSPLPQRFT